MTDNPCLATIRGLPDFPQITEINVRSGPGTNYPIAFKGPVGMDELTIFEVAIDNEGRNLNGKVYQWFRIQFHGGAVGWVRDDLLNIKGECAGLGYSIHPPDTFAFALSRDITVKAQEAPETVETVEKQADTMKPVTAEARGIVDIARVQKASIGITAAFEGSGYDAYNNYDAGIISYGIIQFTLAAGSLITIINNYLARSNSQTAHQLRAFQPRIQAQDSSLRNDDSLRSLLQLAAKEPEMQQVQDELAIANFWNRTIDNFVTPRGYIYPLTYALLFDISVNFGVGDAFVRMAERDLGVPSRSRPEDSGVSEQAIIDRVTQLRKISHDKQAARDNLPGLSARGDFWVALVQNQDWDLQGDDGGHLFPGSRKVQVANP